MTILLAHIVGFIAWWVFGTFLFEYARIPVGLYLADSHKNDNFIVSNLKAATLAVSALLLLGPVKWLQLISIPFIKFARWVKDDLDEYHKMMDIYCETEH